MLVGYDMVCIIVLINKRLLYDGGSISATLFKYVLYELLMDSMDYGLWDCFIWCMFVLSMGCVYVVVGVLT